ncbi:MAG: Ig-like domain-containing protein, partial [Oscillospiraceae bacterium]|nr:Ig-like domain-containing protein [Oscillospiraceae bacterium]
MKINGKKLLAFFFATVMLVSMLPAFNAAADEIDYVPQKRIDWIGDYPLQVTKIGPNGDELWDDIFNWKTLESGNPDLLASELDPAQLFLEIEFSFLIRDGDGKDIGADGYAAMTPIDPRFNLRDSIGGGDDERRYSLEFTHAASPFAYGANTISMPMIDVLKWKTPDNPPKVEVKVNGVETTDFDAGTNGGEDNGADNDRVIEWNDLAQARFSMKSCKEPESIYYTTHIEFTVTKFQITHYVDASTLPSVDEVTVSPAEVSVVKGGTQPFAAEVTGPNNPSQSVTWRVAGNTSTTTR